MPIRRLDTAAGLTVTYRVVNDETGAEVIASTAAVVDMGGLRYSTATSIPAGQSVEWSIGGVYSLTTDPLADNAGITEAKNNSASAAQSATLIHGTDFPALAGAVAGVASRTANLPAEPASKSDVAVVVNQPAQSTAGIEALIAQIPAPIVNITPSPVPVGVPITPATLGTDGKAIGRVQPYGVVTVYRAGVAEYQFDADPDGDFSYALPAGSLWTLRSRRANYRDAIAEVAT